MAPTMSHKYNNHTIGELTLWGGQVSWLHIMLCSFSLFTLLVFWNKMMNFAKRMLNLSCIGNFGKSTLFYEKCLYKYFRGLTWVIWLLHSYSNNSTLGNTRQIDCLTYFDVFLEWRIDEATIWQWDLEGLELWGYMNFYYDTYLITRSWLNNLTFGLFFEIVCYL